MDQKVFQARMADLGRWRCERKRGNGQGGGVCAGAPHHSCRFELNRSVRPTLLRIRSQRGDSKIC